MNILVCAIILAVVGTCLAWPHLISRLESASNSPSLNNDLIQEQEQILQLLSELELDRSTNKIDANAFEQMQTEYLASLAVLRKKISGET